MLYEVITSPHRLPFHLQAFQSGFFHSTFFPDECAHCYSIPSIGQDLIAAIQDRDILSFWMSPDKIPDWPFCGTAHRFHLFEAIWPLSWCVQCRLWPNKAGNHEFLPCHSIRCLCRLECEARAVDAAHKMAKPCHWADPRTLSVF